MNWLALVLALILTLGSSVGRAEMLVPELSGTWSLTSFVARQADGSEVSWCLNPTGLLTYAKSGYMAVGINCDKNTPVGSPSQGAGNRLFYSGRYDVNGDASTITHHVFNSSFDVFLGKDLLRSFELQGDELTLKTIGEKNNTLKWKKIAK